MAYYWILVNVHTTSLYEKGVNYKKGVALLPQGFPLHQLYIQQFI